MQGYKLSEMAARAARGDAYQPAAKAPMQVSPIAVARAAVAPRDRYAMDAAQVFKPYDFADGILPDGMAMDSTLPAMSGTVAAWAMQSALREGQGFFGYPYLAQLQQRAEYRHAAEIWAEHAVRKWIKIVGGTDAQRAKIEDAFDQLNVRDVVQEWLGHDQGFGRGQIFLDFDDADKDEEIATPLRLIPQKIGPKRPLKRLNVVEPLWSAPGVYATTNPLRADFYKPEHWFVFGRKVHSTRMLTVVSRPVSDMLKPSYAFGGLSLTQIMAPYVDNWLRTREAVSDMINSFSLVVLATDMSSAMGPSGTGSDLYNRIDLQNAVRDNRGMFVVDKDNEDLSNIAVPLSGLHELQAQAQEQMASVARIPLSIYLQVTPTGLNASSDGETRNFYADVHAYQEKSVRPHLQTIFEVVQLSALGEIVKDLKFEFVPLWEMSDKDKSDIRKTDADADIGYVTAGIVSPEEVRERLSNDESSLYHGVDLTDAPPELPDPTDGNAPNDDDAGDEPAQDEFREEDHPRAANGQFGSGGGGASKGSGKADKPDAPAESKPAATAKPPKPVAPVVQGILGDDNIARLRTLIADKKSTSAEILAILKPLDDVGKDRAPTLGQDVTPDAAFWAGRQYVVDGKPASIQEAGAALVRKAESYADEGGGVKYEKKARILLGPPAAGKSTSAEEIARQGGYAIADSDDAKKIIPEFDSGVGASAVHEESSYMGEAVVDQLLNSGANVILPLVGAKPASIERRIQVLKDAGYSVTVDLVDVHEDEAARRMAARALSSGRHIASGYFMSIGNNPEKTYEHLKNTHADLAYGRINGNGGPREERYDEAINHPDASPGKPLFGTS